MNFELPLKSEKHGRDKVFTGILWSAGIHGFAALLLLTGLIGPAPPRIAKVFDPCLKVDLVSLSRVGLAKESNNFRPLVRKEGAEKKEAQPEAREPALLTNISQDNPAVHRTSAPADLTGSAIASQDIRAGQAALTKGFSVASLGRQGYFPAATGKEGLDGKGKSATPGETLQASPRYRDHGPPAYPRLAQARGYEGTVLLSVEVLADGRVGRTRVKSSSGYAQLDQSALEAMKQWSFEPGKKKGLPAAMWVDIPIRFALQ